ncbi:hypothetical protein [Pantoea sp. Lu_F5_004]|uniref:hypothetical protein n=1 Tax=Pantoea TaxID=53335 RepID=UPI003EC02067
MKKKSKIYNLKKILIIVAFFCFFLTIIAVKFKLGTKSALLFLPVFIAITFTRCVYPKYKKTIKSAVDFILYFSASLTAVSYIVIKDGYLNEIQSKIEIDPLLIFIITYSIAITTLVKCCISYCDAVESRHEEFTKLLQESTEKKIEAERKNKDSEVNKLFIVVATLFFLIFK